MLPLSVKVYEEIISTIKSNKLSECQNALEEKFQSISPLTLGSILSNHVTRRMKINHPKINYPDKINALYQRYLKEVAEDQKPGILIRIGDEIEICPVLVARAILEAYIRDDTSKEKTCTEDGQQILSPLLSWNEIRSEVGKLITDSTKIPNRHLSYEVYLCTVHDNHYGPISEAIKAAIGVEYEKLLQEQLNQQKIFFSDESKLRQSGFDKTPDALLTVPITIDGQVINWIESKATFGDEETHTDYVNNQLRSYWNRFGSGMVIYWLGYVQSLPSLTDFTLLIRDHLPSDIVHFDPISISPNSDDIKMHCSGSES